MARITVEDCLDKIENRFVLVLAASKRAQELKSGAPERLDWNEDKPTVLALREIAAGEITEDILSKPQSSADAEEMGDLDALHRDIAESKPKTVPEQKDDELDDREAAEEQDSDEPTDEAMPDVAEVTAESDEDKPDPA